MGKTLRKVNRNYNNRGRWDEAFKDDLFAIPSKATKVRLYNEFDEIPTHWVEFYSKKKEGKTGFYALCLNWNHETGEQEDNGCPYCTHGHALALQCRHGRFIHADGQRTLLKGNAAVEARPDLHRRPRHVAHRVDQLHRKVPQYHLSKTPKPQNPKTPKPLIDGIILSIFILYVIIYDI